MVKASGECVCKGETRENYLINIMETNNRNINKTTHKNVEKKHKSINVITNINLWS